MFVNAAAIILDTVINASVCNLKESCRWDNILCDYYILIAVQDLLSKVPNKVIRVVYNIQSMFFCAFIPSYPMFYWSMGLVDICPVSPLYLSMFWVSFCGCWFAGNLEKKTSILKAYLSCSKFICTCPAKLKKQDWWFSLICMSVFVNFGCHILHAYMFSVWVQTCVS